MSSNYGLQNKLICRAEVVHSNLNRHFTASAVVITDSHILLIHHKRIAAWLPPGGHIDADEMPHQAAEREAMEETGVLVKVMTEPMPQTGVNENFFLPQPLCMHAVQAVENSEAIFHMDLAYLCSPSIKGEGLPTIIDSPEVHDARWVRLDHLSQLPLAKNVLEIVALATIKLNLDG